MKITQVGAFLLSCPFDQPIRMSYYGGERTITKRDAMLIRVETDRGITGYAPGQASERAREIISRVVAPFLTGLTLADPDALRVKFLNGPGGEDEQLARVYCSVEIALYDALGQALGVPVSELIGGRVRDRIRLYGSAGMYQAPEQYADEAAAIAELGFRAYKMRPALGPDGDVESVRRMRAAVGPAVDLMVDAHTWWRMGDRSYDQDTVHEVAREFSKYEIAWLEEPLPPDDHQAYRRLREAAYVPLASGEHEPDEIRYLDLISNESVDYVQMDVVCQGGYTTARRLLGEIARGGMRFAFHSWGTALEVTAAAQLGICWPETVVEWLEYPCYSGPGRAGMYPFPLADEIVRDPLHIERGELLVPKEAGLGVRVDESVVDRYPWIPGPWSTFTLHSPPETWSVMGDHSVRWMEQ